MSNLNNRVKQLENIANPHEPKIYLVMIYGDDGRVQYGSDELIGKTGEEVAAYLGEGAIIRRVGVDMDRI